MAFTKKFRSAIVNRKPDCFPILFSMHFRFKQSLFQQRLLHLKRNSPTIFSY